MILQTSIPKKRSFDRFFGVAPSFRPAAFHKWIHLSLQISGSGGTTEDR